MDTKKPKPTIDERLEALAQYLELTNIDIREFRKQKDIPGYEGVQTTLNVLLTEIAVYLKTHGENRKGK